MTGTKSLHAVRRQGNLNGTGLGIIKIDETTGKATFETGAVGSGLAGIPWALVAGVALGGYLIYQQLKRNY
jgi:hypothetical protein